MTKIIDLGTWMTFKVSDNQYGWPHLSDSWASCQRLLPFDQLVGRRWR